MQKVVGLFVMLFIGMNNMNAQQNTLGTTGKWGSQIFLSDVYGRAFENKYDDISGTAYFFPEYKLASILLSDGRKYTNVKAKLNLLEHEVAFIASNGVEGYIGKGLVSTISVIDSTKKGIMSYTFQSGFPIIDNQTNLSFYEVLNVGEAHLLKSINKKIEERGNELSGEKYKEFITRENWYFEEKGVVQRVKKDKAFFAQIFALYGDAFNQFVNANKLNFKTEDQMIKLIDYYNQLKSQRSK